MITKTLRFLFLGSICSVAAAAQDRPLELFTSLVYSDAPPPPDSFSQWASALDVVGVANMPTVIAIHIPRQGGNLDVNISLENMDRREGFGERDPWACENGDLSGCTIIPFPGFPADEFSYTWSGQGNGYDLRLTVHRGNAVGVITGQIGRFAITWNLLKELNQSFFRMDDSLDQGDPTISRVNPTKPNSYSPVDTWTDQKISEATVGKIDLRTPSAVSTATQLDMLILVTDQARVQAGGNPTDCRDMTGAMAYVYQNINSMNTAFNRSLIPAQIGTVTVARLNGYTVTPYAGNPLTIATNLRAIQGRPNIETFRNLVGADVVSTLLDTQTNLGVCGASFIQRPGGCGVNGSGCTNGPAFANWTYLLETVQCAFVDSFTHELGHTLGAEHDPQWSSVGTTPGLASFTYSFGYAKRATGASPGFETIMSQQFNPSLFPVRLLQFSNPNVNFNGVPTGTPPTGSTTVAQNDNALTLTNLAPFTAGFRSRPDLIFASGFDETNACPAINW